jgi:hypothetical protein
MINVKEEEFKSIYYGKYKVLKVNENSSKEEITVSELRDFLNELIEAGYGNLEVEAEGDVDVVSLRDKAFIRKEKNVIRFY